MPFNGVNPHSVVILDNCATCTHHVTEVTAILRDIGVLVHAFAKTTAAPLRALAKDSPCFGLFGVS